MASLLERAAGRYRNFYQPPIATFRTFLPFVVDKAGIEIGGPSDMFRGRRPIPLYSRIGSLDNCDFSSNTVWATHTSQFVFDPAKSPGRVFVCDGSQLDPVATSAYDFLLSSHNLEHFANPVKALHEWKRVLRPGGALILILPHYRHTFDHRRTPTAVQNMLDDFDRNTGEDDLSHLDEILEHHDLSRDPLAGTPEQFRQRSLENFNNRCLHHHVFDEHNSRDLLNAVKFKVLAVDFAPPFHLCLLATTD